MTNINFISGLEISQSDLHKIVDMALQYKKGKLSDLDKKVVTLFFANPSLRTRLSFETGIKKMNGIVNILGGADTWNFEYESNVVMDSDKQEHIKEMAKVVSRYSDLIGIRKSDLITTGASQNQNESWGEYKKDQAILKLAEFAEVPVINMESNMHHPCQGLADAMTMTEKLQNLKGKKYVLSWAPHVKPLPLATPHSQVLFPAMFGMDVTLVHPEGFNLDDEVLEQAKKSAIKAGGNLTVSHDQNEAFKDAEVIQAKSWACLKYFGEWGKELEYRQKFKDWTIDKQKMDLTQNAFFMHCLPVRRNVVVSDEVLDSEQSIVFDQAENRMWSQMALINYLLNL